MTQRDKVLAMLEESPDGVTNAQFAAARILRYSARIEELREQGHEIVCERRSGSTFVYRLAGRVLVGDYLADEPRWYTERVEWA